jgi:hypothetical protein
MKGRQNNAPNCTGGRDFAYDRLDAAIGMGLDVFIRDAPSAKSPIPLGSQQKSLAQRSTKAIILPCVLIATWKCFHTQQAITTHRAIPDTKAMSLLSINHGQV